MSRTSNRSGGALRSSVVDRMYTLSGAERPVLTQPPSRSEPIKPPKRKPSKPKRNPDLIERLAGIEGLSEETERAYLGTDQNSPIGTFNRVVTAPLADAGWIGVQAVGQGFDWALRGLDNAARKTGLSETLRSGPGAEFQPGTAIGAFFEAFPLAGIFGTPAPIANALTKAQVSARPALGSTGRFLENFYVNEDGTLKMLPAPPSETLRVTHRSSQPALREVDPAKVGTNRKPDGNTFTNRNEANQARTATGGRAYFGLRTGEPGGYVDEVGAGPFVYSGEVPKHRILDSDGPEYDRFLQQADEIRSDPKALEAWGLPSAAARSTVVERLIKEAGFDGVRYGPEWSQKYGSKQGEVLQTWGDPVPVERVTPTVPEDFLPQNIDNVLNRDDWAVMTAENPNARALSPEENAFRNQQLLERIEAEGATAYPAQGRYGDNPENSFLVSPINQSAALRLGGAAEQDSVLTNRGLLYSDGSISPAQNAQAFREAPDDFYTSLPTREGDANFAIGLPFDESRNLTKLPDTTRRPGDYSGPALREYAQEAPAPRQAPAILKEQLPRVPDFGYPVTHSKLKNQPSYDDLGVEFEQTVPMAQRNIVSPEYLQGGTLISGMSDLTRAGGVLKGIQGNKWENGVNLQGGQGFMQTQAAADTGMIWASEKGPMTAAMNRAREAEGDAYFTPFTMNSGGSDYSHHMTDAIINALDVAPKAARREFDDYFRDRYADFEGTLGVINEERRAALQGQLRSNPSMRTNLAKELDKAKWRDAGMPDIGALRQAVNDPNLARAPTESFGYSIGKIDPTRDTVVGGEVPHTTYSTQLPGEYLGGFESQVPPNIMFPDLFDDVMSRPTGGRDRIGYNLKLGMPIQQADQKWLDGIMSYLEYARSHPDLNWEP